MTSRDALTMITIPASRIYVVPGFNSRKDFAPKPGGDVLSDPELMADIKARGLDSPIRVEPIKAGTLLKDLAGGPDIEAPHDSYNLIFGERRLRACKAIDPEFPVMATVQPADQRNPLGRRMANLQENLNRKGLTLWETGEAMAEMTEPPYKLDKKAIAKMLGYTETHVGNMLRLRSKLAPEIWEHVRKVGSSIDRAVLFRICMLKKEEQMPAYQAELDARKTRGAATKARKERAKAVKGKRAAKAQEEGEADEEEDTTPAASKAHANRCAKLLADLDENPLGSKQMEKGARAAVAFILGDNEAFS